MTTQREGLENILSKYDSNPILKKLFISKWLEDINWHKANEIWWIEKVTLTEKDYLRRVDTLVRSNTVDINETYNYRKIDSETLRQFKNMDTVVSSFSYIFGWGMGDEFNNICNDNIKLVEFLAELIGGKNV